MEKLRIAIRGLSGSGKGTVANLVARELNATHVDCGLIYRALAMAGVNGGNPEIADVGQVVLVDGKVYRKDGLRKESVGLIAAKACSDHRIAELYRRIAEKFVNKHHRVVYEGRNAGIDISPNPNKAFFLDVQVDERARRRSKQIGGLSLEETKLLIQNRDALDMSRNPTLCVPTSREHVIVNEGKSAHEAAKEIIKLI